MQPVAADAAGLIGDVAVMPRSTQSARGMQPLTHQLRAAVAENL